jgi:ribonuclease HI
VIPVWLAGRSAPTTSRIHENAVVSSSSDVPAPLTAGARAAEEATDPATLPDRLRELLHIQPKLAEVLAANPSSPPDVLAILATSANRGVRLRVARNLSSPVDTIAGLADDDPDSAVRGTAVLNQFARHAPDAADVARWTKKQRRAAAHHPDTSPAVLAVLALGGKSLRIVVARHPHTPPFVLQILASQYKGARAGVATNPAATEALLTGLAQDSSVDVRVSLARRPGLPDAVRRRLADDADPRVLTSLEPRTRARQSAPPRPAREGRPRKKVLYAACDGSRHPARRQGGWAWVTEEGRWHAQPAVGSIRVLELEAIVGFAYWLNLRTSPAVLFSDSQIAVGIVNDEDPPPAEFRRTGPLYITRQLIRDGRLIVKWVPGHSGHPLHDLADRLALLRHRATWMEMTDEEVLRTGDQYVEQAKPTLLTWAAARDDIGSASNPAGDGRSPSRATP